VKNIDIETFYSKTVGHMNVAGTFVNNPTLPKIIRSCRLKPSSVFDPNFQFSAKLEKHWVDEFGNSVYLDSGHTKIIMGDIGINADSKNCTDLFYGNAIKTISENSKVAFIASGTNILSGGDLFLVSFYGVDEYIRTFIFTQSRWIRVSPLTMGINTLTLFFNNVNKQITDLDKKLLDFIIPFNINKCVITSWPMKQDIVSYFNNETLTNSI
jgi:hypothetical protein